MAATAQAITFENPQSLYLNTLDLPTAAPSTTSVLVEFLAAPINPIDCLVLAGQYPVKPQTFVADLPVPGYDGVARVISTGADVAQFKPGQHVVVKRHGLGTWRTHAYLEAADLLSVEAKLDPSLAAILRMGAAPAFYLLEENSRDLRVGDWIVHSASNGVIAHFLTQLAKLRGLKVMAIVQDTPSSGGATESFESVARRLRAHGADAVIQEGDLTAGRTAPLFADKRIKLALDAVGGVVGEGMASICSSGATFVTYGFLSGTAATPMSVTPGMTWANNVTFKGFRLSRAFANTGHAEQQDLLDWLASMLLDGKLTAPRLQRVVWERNHGNVLEKIQTAVSQASDKSLRGKPKTVIVFQ